MLSLFFDGVPPLRSEVSVTTAADPNGKAAGAFPVASWRVHEPVKDCARCHGPEPRRGFSSKVRLVAEVPQLCYQCHGKFSALEGWVHGPVAAGDCLLCHQPHRTQTEALLRHPIPALCYQCHETRAIHQIEKHDQPSYAHCTDCHEGHSSTTKSLLRVSMAALKQGTGGLSPDAPSAEPISPAPAVGDPQESGPEAHATPESKAAELYYRSIRQYRAGQLREARDGFFEAVKTGLLPDPMRETAHSYLQKIEEALQESPGLKQPLP